MRVSERRVALPPTLAAPSQAREVVAELLGAVEAPDELRAECALLVSEVVTNAVLHGGGEISLRCAARPDRVRVEVGDGSAVAPEVRNPSQSATTGRGMQLVDALSTGWGVTRHAEGKTVWFELGTTGDRSASRPIAPETHAMRTVILCGAPVALLRTTIEWADTATRELAYLALNGDLEEAFPDGWEPPSLSTSVLDSALQAEPLDGATVDLRFSVPADAREAALERLRLADLTVRLHDQGALLTPMASDEVRRCRRWVLSEIATQLAGGAPTHWDDAGAS